MRSLVRVGGFTLVELLIILAIVGTLVALVAPLGVRQIERTRAEEESLILERALIDVRHRAIDLIHANQLLIRAGGDLLRGLDGGLHAFQNGANRLVG